MDEPVFVIHGVGNRDPQAFTTTVAALQAAAGTTLVPVYWGDLGADDRFIDLALPFRSAGLRDTPETADAPSELLLATLLDEAVEPASGDLPMPLRDAIRQGLDPSRNSGLRDGRDSPDADQVLAALADEWPTTQWLSRSDDPSLLNETGTAIARAVTCTQETDDSWAGLRGAPPADGTLRSLIRRRLADLDRVAGAAMKAVAGRMNHSLRHHLGPGATRFLGDVLVYQRHREQIHARVWEQVAAVDPELGRTPGRPVRLVAHSLGGVIAVDMATAREPLWTSSLLTFGSQSAYFHLCDPRGGQLSPYAGHEPVSLPNSLARWTNLWQPLDVLAFAASRVFRLADGTSPVDLALPHAATAGLWTHSVYWSLPELASAISEAMQPPAS
ncbi:hypothetical protein [Streptomyces purpurascens]|uniref:Uncharacterized protein n=1 Tax=Streptomyces purpurascens TaxID=1924 RepID=A0ABZ1MY37_STREF|nr:hypothetical protein [Streptomyces purpurascens]MCE7052407.1 hypothetical protein [Streptomyces purpurascens]GHA56186.1 hypothetical protein GCM10010303_80100 [Streptomyces purpurascens]